MGIESEIDRDRDEVVNMLYRLRPGDRVTVHTNGAWNDGRSMDIWKIELEVLDDENEYYRIYGKGSRGGEYLLAPTKPEGKGTHPAPEGYHISPEQEHPPSFHTGGAITNIEITR